MSTPQPIEALAASGMLTLINSRTFHPIGVELRILPGGDWSLETYIQPEETKAANRQRIISEQNQIQRTLSENFAERHPQTVFYMPYDA